MNDKSLYPPHDCVFNSMDRTCHQCGAKKPEAPKRPEWPEVFLTVAEVMADRSTCPRHHVGCVLATQDNQLLTTGYNGAVRGGSHCYDVGCLMDADHCVRSVHAELNALLQAAREGIPVHNAVAYCTARPCYRCAAALAQAGVGRVYFIDTYIDSDSKEGRVAEISDLVELVPWR